MRVDKSHLGPTKPAPKATPPLRVGIVPLPDFTLMSLSCFVEFLRMSADERDFSRQIYCAWDLLAGDDQPITASCGFAMIPTRRFGDPTDYDYVVVHGGILHSTKPVPPGVVEFIQGAVAAGVPLIGLCTGQFQLASMGLLDGKRCAVHFSLASALRQLHPNVTPVTEEPVVKDGIITCPGGLAAMNLARELVTEHCGKVRADKTLHYLMADRGFDQMQAATISDEEIGRNCADQRVVNAVGLMQQRVYEPGSVASIASAVGVSERELTKLFDLHLHIPPATYWRQIRLKAAHWMVLNSTRSITQIAHECGFTDSAHLILWFKRTYQTTPSRLRRIRKQVGGH